MKKIFYVCSGCEAEVPDKKPEFCPLCGRRNFDQIEKEVKKDPEDDKYKDKYDEVLEKLEEYSEGTEPEDMKCSFAD